jgi:hypothetical protein
MAGKPVAENSKGFSRARKFGINKRFYRSFGHELSTGSGNLDPQSVESVGDFRRWVRSRTDVLQASINEEDPAESADPKGHTFSKAPAAINA